LNSARRDDTSELSVDVIRLSINVLNLELMVESFEPALEPPAVEPPAIVVLGWAFLDRVQYGWVIGTVKDAP
jgi:hypothetical protein